MTYSDFVKFNSFSQRLILIGVYQTTLGTVLLQNHTHTLYVASSHQPATH